MSKSQKWKLEWSFYLDTDGANTMICAAAASIPASKVSGLKSSDVHATFPNAAE